jgi:hypothetical protein
VIRFSHKSRRSLYCLKSYSPSSAGLTQPEAFPICVSLQVHSKN